MGIGEIIVIIIVIIVIYAVISMRKKPAETGSQSSQKASSGAGPAGKARDNPGEAGTKPKRGYAKWVGGGLGWVFGGPIGAILGVALGSMLDGMNSGQSSYRGTQRGDFAMSLLVLSAVVMKADGKIVKSELEFVRYFFTRQFGEEEGNRLIKMLQEIVKQDIQVRDVSIQVGQFTDYPVKLQLVNYLFGIAAADGVYHPDEVDMISVIAGYMGVSSADFTSIKAMFVKSTGWAYDILEIDSTATDEEVKKAYRDMAKKHHPDKVAHLGDDVKRSATEKFQKVSAAYEEIKKHRGLN
ncbi:MAG: TerB family tellurite resistance protein [Bacteroidales bacterium]|nr:TerB family tellurite resistance protein [Bacteroidales bacterium]